MYPDVKLPVVNTAPGKDHLVENRPAMLDPASGVCHASFWGFVQVALPT